MHRWMVEVLLTRFVLIANIEGDDVIKLMRYDIETGVPKTANILV